MTEQDNNRCHICGRRLTEFKGVRLCLPCTDRYGDYYRFFQSASRDFRNSMDKIIIECPGATIYDSGNTRVVQGVKWNDSHDFSKGYQIVGKAIFAPNHRKHRVIDRDKANNICRCQSCQDLTVRMRILNRQKGQENYQQNSPLMPRDPEHLKKNDYLLKR
jgi:hypothetical protein